MKKITIYQQLTVVILIFALLVMNSSQITSYAAKPDKIRPTTPTNLRATSITSNSVTLGWNASTDNVGVKNYQIYQNNILIGSPTTTTFVVNNLFSAVSYQFYVVAKDAAGNVSLPSNLLTVTTLANTTVPPQTGASKVVGYYAAWGAYSGYTPDKIDVSKITHINYAFANIGSDLRLSLGYPDVDLNNFDKLKVMKQANPALKTLISVGGWSWSGRFSDAALTDASRTIFADSCVDFIVKYGFDGVDIDWEYPVSGGLSTNVRRPEDKQNFTLLLQKVREKLNARGLVDHKSYLLTMAGASGNWYINNTELGILIQYLDYANIMTYDIHGTWDSYTDFNAPLYANADITLQDKWSVDESVNAWIKVGVPAGKIVVGVPFYGYIYKEVANVNNGLYQRYSGGQSISYANIAANYLNTPGYVRYYHSVSKVPWLFNGSVFITYEDEQSMGEKAQYIKSKALGAPCFCCDATKKWKHYFMKIKMGFVCNI